MARTAGATPAPVSDAMPVPLDDCTHSAHLFAPVLVGRKPTVTVQLAPAASRPVQVELRIANPAVAPVTLVLSTPVARDPRLRTTKLLLTVPPTTTLP